MDIRDKILEFMRKKAYNPMKQEELLAALEIKDPSQRQEFIRILEEMEAEGYIIKTKRKNMVLLNG